MSTPGDGKFWKTFESEVYHIAEDGWTLCWKSTATLRPAPHGKHAVYLCAQCARRLERIKARSRQEDEP